MKFMKNMDVQHTIANIAIIGASVSVFASGFLAGRNYIGKKIFEIYDERTISIIHNGVERFYTIIPINKN
ncbi:MAG: hypothetical protein LUD77_09350 [Clostridiales bacterium]|nr:hypothetical protein [Clostridiales bacterium]